MFNLLSEKQQQWVKAEYSQRRLVVALAFAGATALVGIVFLAPSLLVSHYRLQEMTQTADILEHNIAIASKQSLAEIVTVANKKIATLAALPESNLAGILGSIGATRTKDVRLSSFSIQRADKAIAVTVKGRSKDRTSLLDFANKLKQDPKYQKVDLPISNFAQDENIDFTLTLTVSTSTPQ